MNSFLFSRTVATDSEDRRVPTGNAQQKNPAHWWSKRSLQVLYEVLEPGLTVVKEDGYTFVTNKTGKMKVTVRKLHMAKFGTQAKNDTPLKIYGDRRPIPPAGRVTEDTRTAHASD